MADIFSKEKRSEIMSLIRPKGTKPELKVCKELRRRGVYFQEHYRTKYGIADIALPRKKRAIYIDGDFWHGYRFESTKDRLPKVYWRDKIEANIKRDKRTRRALRRSGWSIIRVWEHELKTRHFERTIERIVKFLQS